MKSYTIKIYPHKYMDRVKQDHFAADNIAYEVHKAIKLMLRATDVVIYKDISTNESYEYEIHNPDDIRTKTLRSEIELVFPEVCFNQCWIESQSILSDEESKELEDLLNTVTIPYED